MKPHDFAPGVVFESCEKDVYLNHRWNGTTLEVLKLDGEWERAQIRSRTFWNAEFRAAEKDADKVVRLTRELDEATKTLALTRRVQGDEIELLCKERNRAHEHIRTLRKAVVVVMNHLLPSAVEDVLRRALEETVDL